MLLQNRIVLPVIFSTLALLAGCGNSVNNATPPPSGGFSASSLKGTYVFSTSGSDSSANGFPIQLTGAFTSSGSGSISGGAFSIASGSLGTASNQAITGGSYTVTSDGRGQVTLQNSSGLGPISLDFVLSSSSGGLVTEFDNNGSGSGTLDAQGTVAQSDINGQSFAFLLSGEGSVGLFLTAGAFTLDSNGAVSTGLQDITTYNFNTGASTAQNATINTSSTVAIGTGTAPGSAQFSNSVGGIASGDVYAISKDHLKFIETDGLQLITGDVFTQQSSLPTGNLAFTMSGADTTVAPLAIGGLLSTSGATITAGVEDYNDAGSTGTASTISGGFSALSNGRAILTLNGIENGGNSLALGNYTFAAYPSTGGTILLEVDGAGASSGSVLVQSSTSFSASAGYAVNLSAVNTSSEEDDIAEFTATSSGFSGLIDVNDEGTLNPDQRLSGNYQTVSSGPAGRYSLTSNAFNGNFYTVDGSTVLFLEMDNDQVGTAIFETQSAPSSSANLARAAVLHPNFHLGRGANKLRRK